VITDWRQSPFGVASVACGLVAFLVATLPFGIAAVCFATVALRRATATGTSKVLSYVGYGLGVGALVVFMFLYNSVRI
jgi:hypothetical protein